MHRQAALSVAIILLIGCSDDSSKSTKDIGAPPAAEAVTVRPLDNQDGSPSLQATGPHAPSARSQHAPMIAPTATGPEVLPSTADSAQESAPDLLKRQAEAELQDGVLSVTTQLHAQYEDEERAEDWATYVEERLKLHFVGRQFSNLDVARIGCKTSICEILAVTRATTSTSTALNAWQDEVLLLPRQEWWERAQMRQPSFQVSSTSDGRSLFVTHLTRKP